MLRNYLKIAWRNLSRNKVFTLINVLGLALGLTAVMLITLYVKDELSYDRFLENRQNIYHVVTHEVNPDGKVEFTGTNTGTVQGPLFAENIPGIASFVRIASDYKDVKVGDQIEGQSFFQVDPSFFEIFSFPLVSGDRNSALNDPFSVVLSEQKALQLYGTTDVIGKVLQINNEGTFENYEVRAVAKKCPQNSSIKFDMLVPIKVDVSSYQNPENWFNFYLNTFVVLTTNTDVARVNEEMNKYAMEQSGETLVRLQKKYDYNTSTEYMLNPIENLHLSTAYGANNGLSDASNPLYSYLLSGIALFILLIAGINFVNLSISQSLSRAREIGVRKVVGGERSQLIFQFMSESFLVTLAGFVLAICFTLMFLPSFNELSDKNLSFSYLLDTKLIIAYAVTLILSAVLAGFYPAVVISGFNPVSAIYNRYRFSGKNYLQKSLVVFQFALAGLFIILSMVVNSQLDLLTTRDLGYNDEDLITVPKMNMAGEEAVTFKTELEKSTDILLASPKNMGYWSTGGRINGEETIRFAIEGVGFDYLSVLEITLVAGRDFSKEFPSDATQSVLVNESFVKKAGWKKPIGQTVRMNNDFEAPLQVIGVVKDYNYNSLYAEIGPQLFKIQNENLGVMNIKVAHGKEADALVHIKNTFKELFPLSSYSYEFKEIANQNQYQQEAKWRQIAWISTLITVFISCIGLFGLAKVSSEKRIKEIGVRKILGASVKGLVGLLSFDFLKLIAVSFVFAFPTAYYLSEKFLEKYPYRTEINLWFFIAAVLISIVIAFLTIGFQSAKAALMSPVKSLRSE